MTEPVARRARPGPRHRRRGAAVSPRWATALSGAAVVVIVIVISAQRTPPHPRAGATPSSGTTATALSPPTEPLPSVLQRPFAHVSVSGVVDAFDRPDSAVTLGSPAERAPFAWRSVAGTWGIQGGQARVTTPDPDRNLAIVSEPPGNIAIEVRLGRLASGAGLVFRYQDSKNYWMVVAVPAYATWAIVKVTAGQGQSVATTDLAPVADATTVSVLLRGARIDVAVNGELRTTLSDGTSAGGDVGLTAAGPDATVARFEDFRIGAPPAA